ncbi:hypothetical protein BOX15_Mlig007880g2 [Macrostomum lignano]|uniref:Uncharacterized protein n=1 Tax=Macrostomum lignano TaxID=282301 RepID=A0A267G4R4_9PLAT|nr:hypothetical protein BOX15_Mlig002574g1 [Macrostomum lignano]PAA80986.1 hypothetical protein BOX15_Mlig007880g2 [Macrostomum lignano]
MSAHFELDELSQSSESYTVVEVTVVEYSLNFLAVITLLLLIAIVAAAFKNVLVKDKSQASRSITVVAQPLRANKASTKEVSIV